MEIIDFETEAEEIYQSSLDKFNYFRDIKHRYIDYNGIQAEDATREIMDSVRKYYSREYTQIEWDQLESLIRNKVLAGLT